MGEKTGISWTLRSWNPWRGCRKVSPGCKNCYMFTEQYRYGLDPNTVTKTKTWGQPKRWQKVLSGTNKKELVFTCSWSDFFIEEADEWRPDAWKIIENCPNLIFQVLTKRPENIKDRLPPNWNRGYPNVALGVSVENADYYARIGKLIKIPAKWHFISAEPLLGSVKDIPLDDIEWIIVGGESGSNFRLMDLNWAREVRDSCITKKVPFFFKQSSNFFAGRFNILDGRTWEEYPEGWLNDE